MAKDNKDPFPELARAPATKPALTAEEKLAAAEKRIAELEQQAAIREKTAGAALGDEIKAPEGAEPNFEVYLVDARSGQPRPEHPRLKIWAPDRAHAWDQYRRKSGMISTEHRPEIIALTPAA